MSKVFFIERLSDALIPHPWMKRCYYDFKTREVVWVAWPLNYVVILAWKLNLAWAAYRHRESWIDREAEKRLRIKHGKELGRAAGEAKGWQDMACHYCDGMAYYRGLLDRCGETIGVEAFTQDDGGIVEDVLRAKVPELVEKLKRERDEAREEVKELIYIAERGIALAEIDFENDKFGVVSELRDALERIKEGAK